MALGQRLQMEFKSWKSASPRYAVHCKINDGTFWQCHLSTDILDWENAMGDKGGSNTSINTGV